MSKHHLYYRWNRKQLSPPRGPYATSEDAKSKALVDAEPDDDVLIFCEVSYSLPARRIRDWTTV